jgi:hypothetical protein
MSKITVNLDATKLRQLVTKRSYTNKENVEVHLQEIKFELVEVKEPKLIFEEGNRKVFKTHFATAIQTKEQREAKEESFFIGEGYTTEWEKTERQDPTQAAYVPVQDIEGESDGLDF